MEDLYTYIKEQALIGNHGRVLANAERFLQDEKAENRLEVSILKASSEVHQRQYHEGVETLHKAIIEFPDVIEIRLEKSMLMIGLGMYEESRVELNKANELFPENMDVLDKLLYIEEEVNNAPGMLQRCDQILAIDPNEVGALSSKADALTTMGRYDEAVNCCKMTIDIPEIDPLDLSLAYNNLGYTYIKMGELENAKTNLEKSIELDQSYPSPKDNLGWVLANLGQADAGLKLAKESILLDPQNSYAYKNRAKIYLMQEDKKLAIADLKMAKELEYEFSYGQEVNEMLAELG